MVDVAMGMHYIADRGLVHRVSLPGNSPGNVIGCGCLWYVVVSVFVIVGLVRLLIILR